MNVVTLNVNDDQELYEVATALGNIADAVEAGEEIDELAGVLRFAAMKIAAVMAGAYERAEQARNGLN